MNIILSTFIFGLGDDFSIFIMDGLQQEYRTGRRVLASHKTAIFFSSFTAVVGLGALAFAEHPALQSISVISILGMISVVLDEAGKEETTVQPDDYVYVTYLPESCLDSTPENNQSG